MRKLILRLLLFIAVYVLAGHLIKSMMPYYWGNPWWSAKMRILEKTDTRPTVYFIGSSRTYNQIIPAVFDSVMAGTGSAIRSFNLGSQATFTPQTFHFLEHAMESGDIPRGSTVFLDFMDTPKMSSDLTSSARYTYWVDTKEISFIIRTYKECKGRRDYTEFLSGYLIAFLKNTFHISQFKGMVGQYESQYQELDHFNSAGFLSLTKEFSYDPKRRADLSMRMNELRSDTSMIGKKKNKAITVRASNTGSICPVFMDRLTTLNTLCLEKDIDLIHLLAPTLTTKSEWAAFNALPQKTRIDMGDPNVFPEFYQLENLFDRGHLNEKGAQLYTTYLAQEFIRLRTDKN